MAASNDGLIPSERWGWIAPDVLIKGNNTIDEYMLVDKDGKALTHFLLGHAKSKFGSFTVYSELMDGIDDCIISLAVLSEGSIEFPTLGVNLKASRGDVLTFLSDLPFIPQVKILQKKFSFVRKRELVGTGSKTFKVEVLIKDHYTININADTKEEAIEIANEIPIAEWEHPDIPEDLHLIDRRVVRHARWGNLTAEEIV